MLVRAARPSKKVFPRAGTVATEDPQADLEIPDHRSAQRWQVYVCLGSATLLGNSRAASRDQRRRIEVKFIDRILDPSQHRITPGPQFGRAALNRSWNAIERGPCFWSDNAIGDKPVSLLERAQCGLGFCSEVAVDNNSNFCLHLLHQLTCRRTTERGSGSEGARLGGRLNRRNQYGGGSCAGEDRGNP